ncbi:MULTISPECIES: hypothetical protein [unclassified Leucobacter]|uniref:hypothetical protein n=1 Tax=unclassified Leucobacter TaxID=2621730 RepID=UPI003019A8AA
MSHNIDTVSRAVEQLASTSTVPEVVNSPTSALVTDGPGHATVDQFTSTSTKLLTIHARYEPDGAGVTGDGDLFAHAGMRARGSHS